MIAERGEVELLEPYVVTPIFFTGAKTQVLNGVAYMVFYAEQPSTDGERVETVVIARLVASHGAALLAVDRAAESLRMKEPAKVHRTPDGRFLDS